jgi:hypothetical protein
MLDSQATAWMELPDYVFQAVVEYMEGDRKASSGNLRHVCHAWREAHDRLVTVLKPKGAPPYAGVWKKFGGVKKEQFTGSLLNDYALRVLAWVTGLTCISPRGFRKACPKHCSSVSDRQGGAGVVSPLNSNLLGYKLL